MSQFITKSISVCQKKSNEWDIAPSDLVFAAATMLAVLWFFCIW